MNSKAQPKLHRNPLLTEGESFDYSSNEPFLPDHPRMVGVDWLSLGFDLNPDLCDLDGDEWSPTKWKTERVAGVAYNELHKWLEFGSAKVQVQLDLIRFRCYLRFNPSTVVFGKTMLLLSADEVSLVVAKLLDVLQPEVFGTFDTISNDGEIIREPNWQSYIRLSRVDFARNLLIDDPGQFKRIVEEARGKHNPRNERYQEDGVTWGIVQKTRQEGQERLYDKALQLRQDLEKNELSQISEDWFRFETQLQRDRLDRFEVRSLSELSEEKVWNAIEVRFKATGWGVRVPGRGKLTLPLDEMSPQELLRLLGYVSLRNFGLEHLLSSGLRLKYKRLTAKYGLHSDISPDWGAIRGVVDIRKGRIVPLGEG